MTYPNYRNNIVEEYKTVSLAQAVYLELNFPLLRFENRDDTAQKIFVFKNSEDLQAAVYEWDNFEAKVEPKYFLNRMRELKAKITSQPIRRQN